MRGHEERLFPILIYPGGKTELWINGENKYNLPPNGDNIYYVYLILCNDGTLYCGISKDVEKRVKKHNTGKGAKYVRGKRLPARLVYSEPIGTYAEALRREREIKKMTRARKMKLIER
jgi:putative endonuclease